MQQVQQLGLGQFRVWWDEYPDQTLLLNFLPIINHFSLSGNFCLMHWQAKPFGLRRWGAYNSHDDRYTPFDWESFRPGLYSIKLLQIPEATYRSSPSAVVFYQGQFRQLKSGRFTVSSTL